MKNILPRIVQSALLSLMMISAVAQNNVGIGTLNPSSLLDVQGDPANNAFINFQSKVNYSGNLDIRAVEGMSVTADGFGIGGRMTGGYKGLDAIGAGGTYSGTVYGILGSATGTAGIRFGVYGTASGGTNNVGLYGFVNGGASNYGVFGSNPNLAGYAGYFSGRGHFTEELRADKNMIVDDNLGIGTTSPAAKLQIIGGDDAGLNSNGYAQFGPASSWNLVLDDNEIMARSNGAANDLLFQQDAGNILMCGLELGKVGIGVQLASNLPSGYMLAVDGKIIGEELRIQNSNNWPDYVFADHYPLMPLDELSQSIELHKHLPNIPSATTVAQEGILVGDMQKRIMEKIEELTLYVIDLHEINKQQQIEIESLKSELKLLRNK
jgi:hypothetical protein